MRRGSNLGSMSLSFLLKKDRKSSHLVTEHSMKTLDTNHMVNAAEEEYIFHYHADVRQAEDFHSPLFPFQGVWSFRHSSELDLFFVLFKWSNLIKDI